MESLGWHPLCVEGRDVFIRVEEGKASYRTQAEHERLVQREWESIEDRISPPEIRERVRALATDGRPFDEFPKVLQLLIENPGASATWVDFERYPHAAFVHNASFSAMIKEIPEWTFDTYCRPIVYRGPPNSIIRPLLAALRVDKLIGYRVLQYGNEAVVLFLIYAEPRLSRSVHAVEDADLLREHCDDVRGFLEAARGYPESVGAVNAEPKPGWFISTLDTAFCHTSAWRVTMNASQTEFHVEYSAAPRPFVTVADEVHDPAPVLASR